jgi:hypothetical protein
MTHLGGDARLLYECPSHILEGTLKIDLLLVMTAPKRPLIPSPGYPKTTRTPQACSRSQKKSPTVLAMRRPLVNQLECRRDSEATPGSCAPAISRHRTAVSADTHSDVS